jgi:hypothetical protein
MKITEVLEFLLLSTGFANRSFGEGWLPGNQQLSKSIKSKKLPLEGTAA